MRKRIKLKAYVKPKCDCENHYLELLQSLNDNTTTYRRLCCKCGRWWTYTESLEFSQEKDETIVYNALGNPVARFVSLPRIIRKSNTILFDDGRGYTDIYEMRPDGTLGRLIKTEILIGGN